MATFKHIRFGDGLSVVDDGGNQITVSAGVGPAGPAGPPGSPGSGGDANYVFTQSTPAATWSVVHSLGKFPAVDVVDSGGNALLPDVLYVDANHVTVTFAAATTGRVFVN